MALSKTIVDNLEGNFQTFEETICNSKDDLNILKKASQNRVLYAFCDNLVKELGHLLRPKLRENVQEIVTWGASWQSRLRRTLLFINSFFSEHNVPYLVVKTYRSIPYVTYDVDVLVNPSDFTDLASKLKQVGELGRHPGKQTKKQLNFFGSHHLLTIDLHEGFSWQGSSYLDESIVWTNVRKQNVAGVSCPIPSLEVEFLLEAAHLLFERRYITLLDYIHMRRMSKEGLNKQLVLKQAQTHGWDEAFNSLVAIVDAINYYFHNGEHDFFFQNYSNTRFNGDGFDMPYFLSPLLVSKVFREKFTKKGYFPKWDYLYYLFTLSRYYITGKRQYPYYTEWAPLDLIRM